MVIITLIPSDRMKESMAGLHGHGKAATNVHDLGPGFNSMLDHGMLFKIIP